MDFWDIVGSAAAKEITSTALLVGVVVSIFTGWLVPGRTHRREIGTLEAALSKKDELNDKLLDQNQKLLAGVRIADHFYGDFLQPIDHNPPKEGE